ncbi:hypothetical protein CFter6_3048 [Collimonas fungivorans]|uniref:Uncharacterized protein n=1 Tax=Collimonas fungivorans TaxID=158899 RepID=A0A127PD17_9BURK|nr:hypothetical protein CFter6_3048 [Collimonas fungivorans]
MRHAAIAAEFCTCDLGNAATAATRRLQGIAALLAKPCASDIAGIAFHAIILGGCGRTPGILLDAALAAVLAAVWRIVAAAMVSKAQQVFEKAHFLLLCGCTYVCMAPFKTL